MSDGDVTTQVPVADNTAAVREAKRAKRKARYWLPRVLAVLVPATASAWSSYAKSKADAEAGYQVLVEQVKRQGEAIESMQKDNAEWRKLMVAALLKDGDKAAQREMQKPPAGGVGSGSVSARPPRATAQVPMPPAREAIKALGDRPMPKINARMLRDMPEDLDAAIKQRQETQQAAK